MKNGCIAKTYDPFRISFKFLKIQPVNNSYTAITTPCKQDSFYGFIIQHLLQVFFTFGICATKSKIFFSNGFANPAVKTPFL